MDLTDAIESYWNKEIEDGGGKAFAQHFGEVVKGLRAVDFRFAFSETIEVWAIENCYFLHAKTLEGLASGCTR